MTRQQMIAGVRSPHASPPLRHLTMRVYQVDRYGTVTRDGVRVIVPPTQGLTPATDRYPSCAAVGRAGPRATAHWGQFLYALVLAVLMGALVAGVGR
ncbi:hypothetical protein ACQEV4_08515 [Streptomyces shenzhenensis]|uniref:hypothetical protein n=1 Tax=Streptomyces shenzhenensis TaxID=943815 RepID=UPI003D8CCB13